MLDFFYRPRRNRAFGGGNVPFTCTCTGTSGSQTVQVFASNMREAGRKCRKRAEQLNAQLGTDMSCGSWAPLNTRNTIR